MRAVLCGYYGFGNGGDEALLLSLLQMLPASVMPVVLAANHREMQKRYGVECIDRWNLLSVSSAIATSDAFIWGGGSLLQDVSGYRTVLYYGALMQLAQSFSKRTIAWAQGIGPLKRDWSRRYVRGLLSRCTAVSVRDRGSAQLLSDWGIPCELTCDPVWALEPDFNGLLTGDLPAPRIAVVLRPHPDLTPKRLMVIVEALRLLQAMTGGSILCIPFQRPGDEAVAQFVSAQLQGPSLVVSTQDPRALLGLFKTVELTIAMRLHGVLMAAASGSRVWGLSYDPKVDQLLGAIEAPGYKLDALPTEPAVLANRWLDHYRNGSGLSEMQRRTWAERGRINQRVLERVLAP